MTGSNEAPPATPGEAGSSEAQRLDKWLWFARITKSRTVAAQLVLDGKVRVNRVKAVKPSHSVRSGDVLTIATRGRVDVLRVIAPGVRRGPAPQARQLYEVISTVGSATSHSEPGAQGEKGTGRPTKRDRRLAVRLAEGDG